MASRSLEGVRFLILIAWLAATLTLIGLGMVWLIWNWTSPPIMLEDLAKRQEALEAIATPALAVMLLSSILVVFVGAPTRATTWAKTLAHRLGKSR